MTGANEYFGKGPQGFGKGPEKVPKSKENYVMEIKRYSRDCTIRVIGISTENVQAISVIRAIEHVTGLNSVLAVVKDDTSSYDVTLDSKSNATKILSGVEILDKDYECSLMYSDTTVVSFMYIPAFIEDDDIIDMLRDRGIKIVSPVFRRVCVPGTQVADGTRFVKCVFPPHIIALPWSMPFKNAIHLNMFTKNCPYIICGGCGEQGHVARRCRAAKCEHCHELPLKCKCKKGDNLKTRPQPIIAKCNVCDKIACSCVNEVNNVEATGVNDMSTSQEETNNEVSEQTEVKSVDVPESEGLVDDIHNNKNELIVEAAVHMENIVQHETRKRKIANSEDNCSESDENTDVDVKDDDGVDISAPSVSAVEEEKKDEKTGKKVKRNGDSTLLGEEAVNEDLDFGDFDPDHWEKRNDTLCDVTLNNTEGGSGDGDDDSSVCVEENMDEGGDTNEEVDVFFSLC
ncbi:Hypothetical predicted protein [Mytilus galloprovincialis]|uniref:CCHC-type domain-containing protein n=1 Tax=Mytilus galloprovincialis TaxID=29158 RepID=A0A8B6CJZ2_MYTGA|nr:Hypothetical predicted protein [Mytilus galloprovincialis]